MPTAVSAECTGWVYRYSPATRSTFTVHLAIADSANDQHGYEIWMRQGWLADKARVSVNTAHDAVRWLTDHGLLQLLESGKAAGKANRYRFLMPDLAATWTPEGTQSLGTLGAQPLGRGTQPAGTGVPSQRVHNPSVNSTQPKTTTDARSDALAGFDDFWAVYPRKQAKGAARKAWPAAVKAAGPAAILAGAIAYRDSPDRSTEYTAHPATWLRAERWTDEPPPRVDRRGVVAPTTNRTTQGAVFDL